MTIILLCLLCIILYKVELAPVQSFHSDYLSHKNTVLVNGVFVILVYLSHSSAKVNLGGSLDAFYLLFKQHLLQLVVVTFLFYSGYGMFESMKRKKDYTKNLLTMRLPKLFLHYNVAIVLYLMVQYCLGKTYSIPHILKAMIGWSSVGNSNWYIFVILLLYIFIAVAGKITKEQSPLWISHITLALVLIYITLMVKIGMPTRFYNTVLCFNVGAYYSLFKDKIETLVMKNNKTYLIAFLVFLIGYQFFIKLRSEALIYYVFWAFCFMALVLLFSMKVKIKHPVLEWFGKNIFGIYILQRIPINILCYYHVNEQPYLFIGICLIITVLLTLCFNYVLEKMDHLIFK